MPSFLLGIYMNYVKKITLGTIGGLLAALSITQIADNRLKENLIDKQQKFIITQDKIIKNNAKKIKKMQSQIDSLCHKAYFDGMQAVRDSLQTAHFKK